MKVFLGACTVAGALLAIYALKAEIWALFPDGASNYAAIIDPIILFAAIAVAIFGVLWLLGTWAVHALKGLHEQWHQEYLTYSVIKARPSDLTAINDLARQYFGDQASNLDEINRLFQLDQSMLWVVRKDGNPEVQGYLVIMRLSAAGVEALRDKSFNGANPAKEHLCRKNGAAKGIYVGAIAANGIKARAAIIHCLTSFPYRQAYKGAENIYARAATKDGLRTIRKKGFQPLHPPDSSVGSIFIRECV